jgi:DNA modification methylase
MSFVIRKSEMLELPVNQIICGDCLDVLPALPERSVHMVVTSVPYWGLRDYGIEPSIWISAALADYPSPSCEHEWDEFVQPAANGIIYEGGMSGQTLSGNSATRKPKRSAFCIKCGAWRGCYGLEPTVELYVEHTQTIFHEVRRVLRDDGTLWLNMGDSYCSGGRATWRSGASANKGQDVLNDMPRPTQPSELKPKDLIGLPWRVAFALQTDGWYLRQDIIWHKPNPMPESVTDRCTKAHEYIFLLAKSSRYFFDAEAIKEDCSESTHARISQDLAHQVGSYRANGGGKTNGPMKAVIAGSSRKMAKAGSGTKANDSFEAACASTVLNHNKRSVWTVATASFKEAHFATFPPELIRPCVLAGTSQRGCCPQCGAPWERILAKRGGTIGKAWHDHGNDLVEGVSQGSTARVSKMKDGAYEVQTLGWRPTCKCFGDHESVTLKQLIDWPEEFLPAPCVVLDPFAGSGTTGQVAAQEHRNYILIERNPEYVEMARRRVAAAETSVPAAEAKNGQKALFEIVNPEK